MPPSKQTKPAVWRTVSLAVFGFAAFTLAGPAPGDDGVVQDVRQRYTRFETHAGRGYSLATYFYKPYLQYHGYKYHYIVCKTDDPAYLYLFNPYAQTYYGRMRTSGDRVVEYQSLPKASRGPSLASLDENDFRTEASQPPIPESSDGVEMIPPPSKLIEDLLPF